MPRLQKSLTKLIIADPKWWLAETVIAITLLILVNTKVIVSVFSGDAEVTLSPSGALLTHLSDALHIIGDFTLTPTIVTLLFWGGVGTIVYTIVIHIVQGVNDFADAAEIAESYHHPKWYSSQGYWKGVAKAWLLWWIGFCVATLLLLVALFILWPYAVSVFQAGIYGLPNWQAIVQILISIVCASFGMRLINIAIHIFVPSLNQFE